MTTIDIDAIRQREQAATPGPWTPDRVDIKPDVFNPSRPNHRVLTPTGSLSAFCGEGAEGEANAEFIAHARTDVPALLAKVDELTAALAEKDAQLTAANRRNDGLQNDLDSATKANTAWANEVAAAEPQYLIWSNHHKAWWAPNSRGYRSNVNDAGRYTLADAQKEMTRGCGCCQVPEVPVVAELTAGAGTRKLRSVIAAATKAAIEAGQVNRYYAPKVVTVELPAEAVAR